MNRVFLQGAPIAARLILGMIFLWAGLTKISEPALFAQTVRAYNVLPVFLIHPFAIIVPWVEVLSGFALLLGLWTRSNTLVIFLLLVSFAIALAINLYRGEDFSCGCFGLDGTQSTISETFIKNIFLIVLSILLFRATQNPLSLDAFLLHKETARPSQISS